MGEEDVREYFRKKFDDAFMLAITGGRQPKRRPTALRARGHGFETVELDDDGKIIEPMHCICGCYAIVHRPKCPFYCMVT